MQKNQLKSENFNWENAWIANFNNIFGIFNYQKSNALASSSALVREKLDKKIVCV